MRPDTCQHPTSRETSRKPSCARGGYTCCANGVKDSLRESSGVATVHEQLVPYKVQDQELAFVEHGAEAARFAINLVWFRDLVVCAADRQGGGLQREFSDAAIQICVTMKVLFGIPLRQTTGFVESLLRLARLDWRVPDFSTLCRSQKTLNVAIPYRGVSGPLHLLMDATGIKAELEAECNAGVWVHVVLRKY
ncbi:DDE family transposase [Donghicola tyrosinivorans]|uniref:DDE family transposase n=1 Tax=Donghicola tyrosinivorans TaxID=1652492 RepID=A0A2T0WS20_9RHOB|nr:DDE family transposase [Donghicola tyrosinivorans]